METIRIDLINVGYAYIVFVLSFTANILFSLYFNIKIDGSDFNKYLLLNSLKKAIVFILATFLLVLAVDVTVNYLSPFIPQIGDNFKNAVTTSMVVSTIGRAALKYIVEAYRTFATILNGEYSQKVNAKNEKV